MKLYLIFCICSPILFDDGIYNMTRIINTDSMLTLDNGNVEDI